MAVPSPRSRCARFCRFVIWKQGWLLIKFIIYLILSVSVFLAGIALEQSGALHQKYWAAYSFDAAAIALLIKSAASLVQALWPFCYREVGCLRKCLARCSCCCGDLQPSDFRNASEAQLKVLQILAQLTQITNLVDSQEISSIRDRLRFTRPTDNVYYLREMSSVNDQSAVADPEADTGEIRNPKTPLLNATCTNIAYTTPRDNVPSYRYPEVAEQIHRQILELKGDDYLMAASNSECLRCFFYIRNTHDHYLIDELDNMYKVKDVWIPPNIGDSEFLFYGELTLENKGGQKLAFNVVTELPCGDPGSPSSLPVLDEMIHEKQLKLDESDRFGLKENFGTREPFAFRYKFSKPDKKTYETTFDNACKRLEIDQQGMQDGFYGAGLVFIDNPAQRKPGEKPQYCTVLAEDYCQLHTKEDHCKVRLIMDKLFLRSS
ncbi:hypothetical protein BV898_05502 [Hypsibius exemplaris]|uniref:Uncharacterized protein n=1 Tax=Hypsibius exemplaris TaxID=2072580 RepID=A0A1W0WZ28_HYPEX|nr:hypothetical protein BV898_05502 [Hypsibius exemplaris]